MKPGGRCGSGGPDRAAAARLWPGVESAESEEEFSRKFRDAVALMRNVGLFLGGVLTLAGILSVASAVRLALDMHREEVGIMRLMGATEGAIRAPFWLYAIRRGAARRSIALGLLYATYRLATSGSPAIRTRSSRSSGSDSSIPVALLLLPAAGAAAGLVGSLLSLGSGAPAASRGSRRLPGSRRRHDAWRPSPGFFL